MKADPDFPNLPFVSDAEFKTWSEDEKFHRHCLEIAEAAKIFQALQDAGMDPFDAAERLPVPRMNRRGMPQAQIRALFQRDRPA
jgi:hypothetical protein